jgi:hypothetical protein
VQKVRRIGYRSEEARDFRFLVGVLIGGDSANENTRECLLLV